jgi:NADH-quinone oxidoreductase subunit H
VIAQISLLPLLIAPLEAVRRAVGDDLFYYAVSPALKILALLFLGILPLITYLVLAERKILGFIQARVGPNRVGPWGLLQPIADVMKLLVKEDTLPAQAVKWAFILAPCLVVAPAFIIFSVIPIGPRAGEQGPLAWYVTDVNTGVLFIVALATIGVYGLIIGGWSSNNKFSLMGGLRSAAQMISYEVPQGLSLVGPLMLAGTMSLVGVVEAQKNSHWWYVFPQLVAFFIYLVAGVAESNRNPFDLPEAESELVAGFHTEYSGMRFALFFLGEYANMIVISAVATTLFLGGWLRPFPNVAALAFLDVIPGAIWFILKVFVFLFVYIWFRGTFPRYRFDQLMDLGWKWMIPLALLNIFVTGLLKLLVHPA